MDQKNLTSQNHRSAQDENSPKKHVKHARTKGWCPYKSPITSLCVCKNMWRVCADVHDGDKTRINIDGNDHQDDTSDDTEEGGNSVGAVSGPTATALGFAEPLNMDGGSAVVTVEEPTRTSFNIKARNLLLFCVVRGITWWFNRVLPLFFSGERVREGVAPADQASRGGYSKRYQ